MKFFWKCITSKSWSSSARQCSIYAGIKNDVPATTVNKVCASTKAIMLGAQSIKWRQ